MSPKSFKKHCREAPQKQYPKKYQFCVTLGGGQKCTKSVPGMVEMMPWAPLGVSRRTQWHQKPPRKALGGVRRSIFISFYQFGRHGGGKAAGNWILTSIGRPWAADWPDPTPDFCWPDPSLLSARPDTETSAKVTLYFPQIGAHPIWQTFIFYAAACRNFDVNPPPSKAFDRKRQ